MGRRRLWRLWLVAVTAGACSRGSPRSDLEASPPANPAQTATTGTAVPSAHGQTNAVPATQSALAGTRTAAPEVSGRAVDAPREAAELLAAWTRALNASDIAALGPLYGDSVRYYGQVLKHAEVIARKRSALAKTPTFRQEVLGKPKIERAGNVTRVGFLKRSGPADSQRDVFATVVLEHAPTLHIVEETDLPTQGNAPKAEESNVAPENCSEAVSLLVDSTKQANRLYAQIDKNLRNFPESADLHAGGMGPLMPADVGGETYDMAIGVHHPERFEAYGWFSVDRDGKVTVSSMALEAYDQVVDTNADALATFKRLCPTSAK